MQKKEIFTTIENQIRDDGSMGLLYDHFDDIDRAYAKLYTILAAAAVSGIPYHSGHIYSSSGYLIEGRVFDRRDDGSEPVPPNDETEEESAK